ncbi:MAG: hypothetical protein ACI4M3_04770 [Acutalibacteraceae bacterium]
MKKIALYEPWFFLFFGAFHLHRIWGLIDRKSYADFWIGVLEEKGIFYFVLMAGLCTLCILGIITFFKNMHHNYWWRSIYLIGGSYLLFDLFSIAVNLNFWHELILKMYDITSKYWNMIWAVFILLGGMSFLLGIKLLLDYQKQNTKRTNRKVGKL